MVSTWEYKTDMMCIFKILGDWEMIMFKETKIVLILKSLKANIDVMGYVISHDHIKWKSRLKNQVANSCS